MEFIPHSYKQEEVIFSDADITALVTGIQWGKTFSGALWLRRQIHEFTNENDNFLLVAPTYKIMVQSSYPAFMNVFRDIGKINKGEWSFKINGGGTIYLRSGTEPDSIVGVTNVRAIWGDEAGKFTNYFWQNIEGRAAFANGRIMLTTTPYSMNWLYRELVKPHREGKRPDVKLIGAKSIENPYFNEKVYHKRKLTMDPRMFKAMYEGSFEQMQGLVYDCFNEDAHRIEGFKHYDGVTYYAGVDWGFTDPFVFNIRAVTPDGFHFLVSEFCKSSLTPNDQIRIAKNKCDMYNIKHVYCDPSMPGMIKEFQQVGIPAVGAENDIITGVGRHYELIKSGRYKVVKGVAPNTIDEYSMYHWPEPQDLQPDQNAKPQKPVDQSNHCIAKGSLISTIKGDIPIQNIKIGDLVLTRKGYKKVTKKWDNGIREVILLNGKLYCTKDHLVWTNLGWRRAEELRPGLKLLEKRQDLMAYFITDILMPTIIQIGNISKNLGNYFIGLFGNITMEKSQKINTFTTLTEILQTIKSKILSLLIKRNIFQSMLKNNGETKAQKSLKININTLKKFKKRPKNGTEVKREGFGIQSMPITPLERSNTHQGTATYARKFTLQGILDLDFALINAGQLSDERAVPIISKRLVRLAVKYSPLTSIVTGNTVQTNAAQVFDLEVEDAHEFFANNVLVHNCMDVERYLSYHTFDAHLINQPRTIQEINNRPKDLTPDERIKRVKRNTAPKWERFT